MRVLSWPAEGRHRGIRYIDGVGGQERNKGVEPRRTCRTELPCGRRLVAACPSVSSLDARQHNGYATYMFPKCHIFALFCAQEASVTSRTGNSGRAYFARQDDAGTPGRLEAPAAGYSSRPAGP